MSGHLNEEQIVAVALGEAGGEASAHLEACGACRGEAERVLTALAGYARESRAAAERPDSFWAWQHGAILARLAVGTVRTRRLAWTSVTALLILAAVAMNQGTPGGNAAQGYDPDHELLVDVERTVRREVPAALEPAALLAAEMDRAARKNLEPQANTNEGR
jgi:hypothetical protein